MVPFSIDTPARIEAASLLSLAAHGRLRSAQPWLPKKNLDGLTEALTELACRGTLLGLGNPDRPQAFLGGFSLDRFRQGPPGVFCPAFAQGLVPGAGPYQAFGRLYQEASGIWVRDGRIAHGVGAWVGELPSLEAFGLLGFGRVVAEASAPVAWLETSLPRTTARSGCPVRPAVTGDAVLLEALGARLAAHLESPPLFLSSPRVPSAGEWASFLAGPGNLVLVAEGPEGPAGFLKAGAPPPEANLAVQGPETLAIGGLWVEPGHRRQGVASSLVSALAARAREEGKVLVWVDYETANLDAFGFWTRWFHPLAWGLERTLFRQGKNDTFSLAQRPANRYS